MSRLTYYSTNFDSYTSTETFEVLTNKLGPLEDKEDELNCPLQVLLAIKTYREIYVKKYKKHVEVRNVVIYEEGTRPYIEYFILENPKDKIVKVKTVWIDEYKDTWWLDAFPHTDAKRQ